MIACTLIKNNNRRYGATMGFHALVPLANLAKSGRPRGKQSPLPSPISMKFRREFRLYALCATPFVPPSYVPARVPCLPVNTHSFSQNTSRRYIQSIVVLALFSLATHNTSVLLGTEGHGGGDTPAVQPQSRCRGGAVVNAVFPRRGELPEFPLFQTKNYQVIINQTPPMHFSISYLSLSLSHSVHGVIVK